MILGWRSLGSSLQIKMDPRLDFFGRKWLQYKLLGDAGYNVKSYFDELTQQVDAAGYRMSEVEEAANNLAWNYGIIKYRDGS